MARIVPILALGTCWWLPVPCGRGGAMPCGVARSGRRAPAPGCRGARVGYSTHGATSPALPPPSRALGVPLGWPVALGTHRVLLAHCATAVSPWLGRRSQHQKMGLHPSSRALKWHFGGGGGLRVPACCSLLPQRLCRRHGTPGAVVPGPLPKTPPASGLGTPRLPARPVPASFPAAGCARGAHGLVSEQAWVLFIYSFPTLIFPANFGRTRKEAK